jgi:hypothetical protein
MSQPALPLTPFENYMLDDDRPDYPMTFFIRLQFAGQIDQRAFHRAVDRATKRHPLLQSHVRTVNRRRFWVPARRVRSCVQWAMDNQPASSHLPEYLDLRKEIGLRILVRRGRERSSVILQFHHACCDGIAAFQFVEDLLICYAVAQGSADAKTRLRSVQPWRLPTRAQLDKGHIGRLLRMPLNLLASWGIAQFFFNRAAPLVARHTLGASPNHGLSGCTQSINRGQLRQLASKARELGVTINDLLLRDLFSTLHDWNARYGGQGQVGHVRVSVPVNLRRDVHRHLPAANIVSMVFLDRLPKQCSNPARLLRGIRRDTWFVKRFQLGRVFPALVRIYRALWGDCRWMLRREQCLATALLTNLGVRLDALPLPYRDQRLAVGNLLLEQVECLPPIRPLTRAALAVVTYGGQMRLSLRYDTLALDPDAAHQLLDDFVSRLVATAGGDMLPTQGSTLVRPNPRATGANERRLEVTLEAA